MILVVSATTPSETPADVVSAARAKPGVLNYGTAGVGWIAHLTTELLDDTAKVSMMCAFPLQGGGQCGDRLAAGQIQVMISNYSTVAPLMQGGKIRGVGVTSVKPHPAFPDMPPLATVAPGFDVDIWVGVFAPAGTPDAIVARLNQEINAIAASAEPWRPCSSPTARCRKWCTLRDVRGAHQGRARAVEEDRGGATRSWRSNT